MLADVTYEGSLLDDELSELVFDVVSVDTRHSDVSLLFDLPIIGKVELRSTSKDDQSNKIEGVFPLSGSPLVFGPLTINSGVFSLLPDGALSYAGEGFISKKPIELALRRLVFLTMEEKKQMDVVLKKESERAQEKNRAVVLLNNRYEDFLDSKEKKTQASNFLKKKSNKPLQAGDSIWSFVKQSNVIEESQEKKDLKIAPSVSALQDVVAVKEAIFSLTVPEGFFSIPLGTARFDVKQAELVLRYGQNPQLRFFIEVQGKRIETTVSLKEKDVSVEMSVEKLTGAELFSLFGLASPNDQISQAYFSGDFSLNVRTGALFEGVVSDAKGEPLSLLKQDALTVAISQIRIGLHPQKGLALQAVGDFFGAKTEFFGSLDSVDGLIIETGCLVPDITKIMPMLPIDQFSGLAFDGVGRWSVKKGLQLHGRLFRAQQTLITFWGLSLSDVEITCDFSALSVYLSGNFTLFDLSARASLDIALGKEPSIFCSAEFVQDIVDGWAPASLSDYLKGEKRALEPFLLTKLGLVAGVMSKKKPVRSLQKVIKAQEDQEKQKARIPLGSLRSNSLFFAVVGKARMFGQSCRAVVSVQKDSKLGFLLFAEPIEDFSLRYMFPDFFSITSEDSILARYFKNVVGGTALSDVSFVLSSLKDIDAGIKPGLNIMGSIAYVGDPKENPLFAPLFAAEEVPFYFKKDGNRGIGISVSGVVDPINFKNSVVQLGVGTGAVGLFVKLPNVEEVGVKNLALDVKLFPFKSEATIGGGFLYTAQNSEQPMHVSLNGVADLIGFGGDISGEGDFDFAAFLPLIMGRSVRDVLSQRIIFRDGGFVFKTTWVAVASLIESIGSAIPTLGVGTILGAIAFIASSIDSIGFSSEVEIGQKDDPLRARLVFKGGVDISEIIVELLGEKPGGFTSLVCFLFDLLLYVTTFGQKSAILPDMRSVQEQVAKIVPLDLEKFYLKFVPLGTRIGEVVVPFGVGGDVAIKLFGAKVGGNLMLDSGGFYATAYADPIRLWKIYQLQPSKTIGSAAKKIEKEFSAWNLSENKKKEKITIEAIAHLEKGLNIGTDFDVKIADTIGGSLRARLGFEGLDLQGDFLVKIPELAQNLGLPSGGFSFWVKGTQVDLENPLLLLRQLDPKNIGLEVGFEDTLKGALQTFVTNALQGVEAQLSSFINDYLVATVSRSERRALLIAEEKEKRICSAAEQDKSFMAACLDARKTHALLQAKELVLDRLDDAGLALFPEMVRTLLVTLKDLGAGVVRGGSYAFTAANNIFSIEKVFWRGTLQDLSTGVIPGFTVVATVLGQPVELHGVGMFDLTKNPFEWVRSLSFDLTRAVLARILKPISDIDVPQNILLQVQKALSI